MRRPRFTQPPIALLGGNSYQYAFAPTYAQANGKGYITQNELMGADMAATNAQILAAQAGNTPSGADRIEGEKPVWGFLEDLLESGSSIVSDITGARRDSSNGGSQPAPASSPNTALIIGGTVVGVGVLAYALSRPKRRRRR